jgi:glycosyltransferase involved in cell wall biosynthesis
VKILLWSQYFWPEHFHINEVALSLKEAGEELTMLTGKPNYPGGAIFPGYKALGVQWEVHQGMDVVRMPICPRRVGRARDLALNYLSFIASGYVLGPWVLRKMRFDVVFVYAPSPLLQAMPALFFAWMRGIPLVLWVQDLWPEALISTGFVRNRFLLGLTERVVRFIYRHADLLLISSEGFRASVLQRGGSPEKIVYHPNSSGMAPPKAAIQESARLIVEEVGQFFSIVYAGNMGTVQSLDTVIAAASLLRHRPDIRFYLIGGGSQAKSLADQISRLGLGNIHMHGWMATDEIHAVYAAASVLLVPLKDDLYIRHTIPNKLQVYMSVAKPIIVSGNGEVARTLIQADAGLACAAGDVRGLAETVLRMQCMTPDQRSRLGAQGKAYFQQHFELKLKTLTLRGLMRRLLPKET